MFLAITEKEMKVFGIHLPERCVLISQTNGVLMTACTQDKVTGRIDQRVIDPGLYGCNQPEFIFEVNKKNEFHRSPLTVNDALTGERREFFAPPFIDKNAPVVDIERAFDNE